MTEVAVRDELSPEQQALIAQQMDEFDTDTLNVPIMKIGQPLTKEVVDGDAESGEFINTLTGEGVGDAIGFIVAYYQRGRAGADRATGRYYVAFGDTIPESWADFVGDEWVGVPFTEYDDAEERYKERVNAKEIEWGKGPKVSTTHNYTGLAIVSGVDDEEDQIQPVRLSLQRTNVPAVRKINMLYRMTMRNRPFWDKVFNLRTEKRAFDQGQAYLLKPSIGRDTTPEERAEAAMLASAVMAGRVTDNAEKAEATVSAEPNSKGGLGI